MLPQDASVAMKAGDVWYDECSCPLLLISAQLMSRRRNRFPAGGSELLAVARVHFEVQRSIETDFRQVQRAHRQQVEMGVLLSEPRDWLFGQDPDSPNPDLAYWRLTAHVHRVP